MDYKYIMVRDVTEEGEFFGIALVVIHRKKLYAIERYGKLTMDKKEMASLVKDCNEYDLDPIHLKDIVEDFLYVPPDKPAE